MGESLVWTSFAAIVMWLISLSRFPDLGLKSSKLVWSLHSGWVENRVDWWVVLLLFLDVGCCLYGWSPHVISQFKYARTLQHDITRRIHSTMSIWFIMGDSLELKWEINIWSFTPACTVHLTRTWESVCGMDILFNSRTVCSNMSTLQVRVQFVQGNSRSHAPLGNTAPL